ncbi:hypothetical protein EVAR_65346_1 [Eumeta japonica]|uniref:Uncharacterized protein n=1 Tax=Eumeta variegata TaxID=151549 RepID=A0A4C1Z3J9_EUMVA|nr:hypothetical protein EVAR_65346_1 [Eumeta japonica]
MREAIAPKERLATTLRFCIRSLRCYNGDVLQEYTRQGNNNTFHTERGRNTWRPLSKTKYRQRTARARQRVRWLNFSTDGYMRVSPASAVHQPLPVTAFGDCGDTYGYDNAM